MKNKDLSKMTSTNPETIRMYRNMGFLAPEQLENGYYDYSMADFVSLTYLRKLRSYGMSLAEIQDYEKTEDSGTMLDILSREQQEINRQMRSLQEMSHFIELEKRHVTESAEVYRKAEIMQSVDEKLDYYDDNLKTDFFLSQGEVSFYMTTTSTLFIPREILNGEVEDRVIPLKAGVGTYRYMLDRRGMEAPENPVVIPNGKCITQVLSLRTLKSVNIKELAPMMNLSKEIGKPFVSDTTAYLARIRHDEKGRIFDFRVRACIEPNDVADLETKVFKKGNSR